MLVFENRTGKHAEQSILKDEFKIQILHLKMVNREPVVIAGFSLADEKISLAGIG